MINEIIRKANSPFPPEPGHVPDGQYVTEMMIPGPKVGLLIGKGGENIRNLQVSLQFSINQIYFFPVAISIFVMNVNFSSFYKKCISMGIFANFRPFKKIANFFKQSEKFSSQPLISLIFC